MRYPVLGFGRPSAGPVGRALAAALLALAGALSPVSSAPAAAPVQWQARVGGQTPDESIQTLAYFPTDVFVNVGDTITWSFDAAEPHTVTLLAPGQAPPAAGTAPATPDHSVYTGMEFVNSGIRTNASAPPTYSVLFNAAGDFTYLCLVHPRTMSARIHVNPAGSPYPHDQAGSDRLARGQARLLFQDGSDLRQDALQAARAAGPGHVAAGNGDAQVFVARFLPERIRIRTGQTVTWTNADSITPHTVTFGPAPSTAATGLDRSGHATISANPVSTTISSGLIGVRRPLGTDFAVTFTAPGTYSYFCSLHADLGMQGTIVVRGREREGDDPDEGGD